MGYDGYIVAFPKDKDNKEYVIQDGRYTLLKTPSYYQEYELISTESLFFHNIIIPYYKKKYEDIRNLDDLSGNYFKITKELADQIIEKSISNEDLDERAKEQIAAFTDILKEYDLYYQYT